MKEQLIWLLLQVLFCGLVQSQPAPEDLKLWYTRPAEFWVEALPLGNGRLGAMVFGIPYRERIQLNENTVWAGSPYRNDNPEMLQALPEIRQLIFDGKYAEAEKLAKDKMVTKGAHGMPYQTVGNLFLSFPGHENYTDYYRELDMQKAIATTTYKVAGTVYKREIFSSFPDQVVIVRITADRPGKINFAVSVDRPAKVTVSTEGNDQLTMTGITSNQEGVTGKLKFYTEVKVVAEGGTVSSNDVALNVSKADAATVYISIGTNFINYQDISDDPVRKAEKYLNEALKKKYVNALNDHVTTFRRMFDRVTLNLGVSDSIRKPTDVRVKEFSKANDPQLAALYFQFGRYLLICSSQPGGQPANLQGIWTDQLFPAWDSKYTVNINTEMNYWPSEITNLTETSDPLVQMMKELSETGRQTARTMYNANGWVLHHNTDLWRFNGAIDGAPGLWPTGGAWLCQQLWEKYKFSGDKEYLKSVYPIMKGAAQFFQDFLIEEPVHKWLVVSPSISPENAPMSIRKQWICIAAGTTLDNLLVFDLFSKTIKAAEILKTDKEFVKSLQELLKRLPPLQIGQFGQLQEWLEDWDNPEDHHRHVSHLYGVYPGGQISPYRTPELFDAARTSLLYRGDASTGWSMGWKINLWARFLDGNHAYKLLTDQIKLIEPKDQNVKGYNENGGTYPNLFDVCPPFQIDGNFGCTAGIAEMLLQSYDGEIFPLPALPDVWKNGKISGLRAAGGFEIAMEWNFGELTRLVIQSALGGICRLRLSNEMVSAAGVKLKPSKGENPNPFYATPIIAKPIISEKAKLNKLSLKPTTLVEFETQAGIMYEFVKK
jgi:alpha-L-fucosidase 2